jgi:hypothetical protein
MICYRLYIFFDMLNWKWTMMRIFTFRVIKMTSFAVSFIPLLLGILCGVASSVMADEYDQIVVLRKMTADGAQHSNRSIANTLPVALTMALTELGITPIDARFAVAPHLDNAETTPEMITALQRYDAEREGRLLIMEVSTTPDLAVPELINPLVSMIDVETGLNTGIVTTLSILPPFDQPGISAAAAALARSIARRMDDNGYRVKPGKIKPWGGPAQSIRLALEGFGGCEQQALLTIMEEEFPGFMGMELEKAPNPTYAIYQYETTATKQRLKKWLQLLMTENRAKTATGVSNNVRLYIQKDDFRLQKVTDTVIFTAQCGG